MSNNEGDIVLTYVSPEIYAALDMLDELRSTDVVKYWEQQQHCLQLLGLTLYGDVHIESVGEHKLFVAFVHDRSHGSSVIRIFDKARVQPAA
jgi:hypothetical protein